MKQHKKASLIFLLLLIHIIFISGFLFKGIILIFPNIIKNTAFVQMLGTAIYFGIPLIIYIIFKKKPLKEIFLLKPLSFKNVIVIILLAFFIQPSLMIINLLTTFLANSIFPESNINEAVNELLKVPFWQTFLAVAIFPAIFEEVIFRGIFFKEYEDYPVKVAIIFSSVFFGIMHCTITQLVYATVAGIIIASIVKVTKSIWAGILFHFVLNGSQIALSHFLTAYMPEVPNDYYSDENLYIYMEAGLKVIIFFAIFLVCVLLSFVLLYLTYRAFKRVNEENIQILKKEEAEKTLEFPKPFNIYFVLSIILFALFIIWDTYA